MKTSHAPFDHHPALRTCSDWACRLTIIWAGVAGWACLAWLLSIVFYPGR